MNKVLIFNNYNKYIFNSNILNFLSVFCFIERFFLEIILIYDNINNVSFILFAFMAELVDAMVSNTIGAIHVGSTPTKGTIITLKAL